MDLLALIDQYNRTRPEGAPWLNQARLAKAAHVSPATVTRHVKGTHPISDDHAVRYARVLGVTVEAIRAAACERTQATPQSQIRREAVQS